MYLLMGTAPDLGEGAVKDTVSLNPERGDFQ